MDDSERIDELEDDVVELEQQLAEHEQRLSRLERGSAGDFGVHPELDELFKKADQMAKSSGARIQKEYDAISALRKAGASQEELDAADARLKAVYAAIAAGVPLPEDEGD